MLCPRFISKGSLAQTGDPTATGTGGESILLLIASQNEAGDMGSRRV
jgi:hypothetical protein